MRARTKQLRRIYRRAEWALEEHKKASSKLLTLLSGLPIDGTLWEEISHHLADTESHLTNILREMPEIPERREIERKHWIEDWRKEAIAATTPPPHLKG